MTRDDDRVGQEAATDGLLCRANQAGEYNRSAFEHLGHGVK